MCHGEGVWALMQDYLILPILQYILAKIANCLLMHNHYYYYLAAWLPPTQREDK